ncbi:unnamed protein product [Penicillium olsonii]|nr:unnamed protein product [Penicillium olsonii]CAG7925771.1 unnamed protein product [Penicillium olsonii]
MSFANLPLEVHCHIISYLLCNRDVAALSIQCRALHSTCDMAARKKYHQIDISGGEDGIDQAFNFLMEILKQPQLALHVRHLKYRTPTSRSSGYKDAAPMRELSSDEMGLIKKAVKIGGFEGPQEDKIVNMLMQRMDNALRSYGGYEERERTQMFITQALAAIIIAVSPNIISMVTTNPRSYYSGIELPLDQILLRANRSPGSTPYLYNLRSVYMISETNITWEDGRFYIAMDLQGFIRLFDRLPSIESVSTDVMEESDLPADTLEKSSSDISKLSICHSSVSSAYLARVIWSCKTLKELRYSIGGRSTNDGGHPIVNAKALIKAMCYHKRTLETIEIDAENDIHDLDRDDPEEVERAFDDYGSPYENGIGEHNRAFMEEIWENSGSLKDFESLKRLSLGVKFLAYFAKGVSAPSGEMRKKAIVADCLPNTLEYLCVRGYEKGASEEDDEQMDALMTFYKSGQSSLKELLGIEETVPHASYVDDPDGNGHLLWPFDEDSGTEDEETSDEE